MPATVELAIYGPGMRYVDQWTDEDLQEARTTLDTVLTTGTHPNSTAQLATVTKIASGGCYYSYSHQWSAHEANVANALLRDIELITALVDDASAEPFSVTTETELPV